MTDQDITDYWYQRAKAAEELLREIKRLHDRWAEHNDDDDINKALELIASYDI